MHKSEGVIVERVACPSCGAAVGTPCRRPVGDRTTELHPLRWFAFRERYACPTCPICGVALDFFALTSVVYFCPEPLGCADGVHQVCRRCAPRESTVTAPFCPDTKTGLVAWRAELA